MTALLLSMRIVHVLTGVFWAGSVFFINSLLGPSLAAAGPEGVRVMMELRRRHYFDVMIGAATFTILSGFALVWIDSDGFQPVWFRSHFGMAISTGMLAALLVWLLGVFVIKPAMEAASDLGRQLAQATTDEARAALAPRFDTARRKLVANGRLSSVGLLVAVITMAVARNL